MQYRIGEVAALFGLTKEGVRYYERKGIIESVRDEMTGYRYYNREAITWLRHIQSYQRLGFTLEDANRMIKHVSFDEAERRLEQKLTELEEKEQLLLAMRKELLAQQEAIRLLREERIELREIPEMVFMPRVQSEDSVDTPQMRRQLARAQEAERIWNVYMPPVALAALHFDANLKPQHRMFGAMVDKETAQRLNLPCDGATLLPARSCVHGYAQSRLGEVPDIEKMAAWIQKRGYQVTDDVYCIFRLAYCGEDGLRHGIHEVLIPVKAL